MECLFCKNSWRISINCCFYSPLQSQDAAFQPGFPPAASFRIILDKVWYVIRTIIWTQKYYWLIYLPVSWIESTFHWRFIYTCIEFSAYAAHIIHADTSVISCIIRAICLIVTSYDNNKWALQKCLYTKAFWRQKSGLCSSASKMPTVLGWGRQCSSQYSAMKSPVHCGNPADHRLTIDTCIPVVHALFFSLIDILSGRISSFSIKIAETKSV